MRKTKLQFFCTNCGEQLFTYDGKQTIPITRRCPACFRFMKFNPSRFEVTEVEPIQRTASSGARFY